MFLKSVEIQGFKSFADRTRLEFHEGVTGIVGPNGCGKSNVVDAIRWVLGETSAKALRGGEMADVIFNGTEQRKPLAMAEVTLTLGDCEEALKVDYNEVSVGRRVFRDGKSEYLINRKPCRLKDINNLFMDTGIGRSSYSVMEQGKIDLLLSSKPEDRRQVFEEAAGITRYKQQKKEALRKLDYTEANLLRIVDVLEEQKRQMASLQRQAAKARRYATLLDQVRTLDTHLAHRQFHHHRAEREELLTSITSLSRTHATLQEALEAGQQRLNETRHAFQEAEARMSDLRQAEAEHQGRIRTARDRIGFNEERAAEFRALIQRNREDLAETEIKLAAEREDLSHTDENLTLVATQIAARETAVRTREEEVASARTARTEAESALAAHQDELGSVRNLVASLVAQLETGAAQAQGESERIRHLDEETARLQAELTGKEASESELSTRQNEESGRKSTLDAERRKLEDALAAARRARAEARDAETTAGRGLTENQTRLATLEQLAQSGEGFEGGTRAVLEGLDQPEFYRPGIRGVLANLIEVEPEFIPAIEAALDHRLQAILVADASMAAAMIDSLRDGNRGRACLFVADASEGSSPRQLLTVPQGGLAWARDKVTADASIQPLLDTWLDQVLLVDTLASAMDLRHSLPGTGFATLDGDYLSAEGLITGGSREQGAGSTLERQAEIRRLRAVVRTGEKLLAERRSALEAANRTATEAEEGVEAQREGLRQCEVRVSTLEGELNLTRREIEQLKGKLAFQENESRELAARQAETASRREGLETRKLSALQTVQHLTEAGPGLTRALDETREAEAASADRLGEARTALAMERQAEETLRLQRAPLATRLQEMDALLARRREEIVRYEERIAAGTAENATLEQDIAGAEAQLATLLESRQSLETGRQDLLQQIEKGEATLTQQRHEADKITEQRNREEVRSTQIELRMENLADQIRQRYQVDLGTFRPDSHALLHVIAEQRKAADRTARRRGIEAEEAPVPEAEAEPAEAVLRDPGEPDWDFVEAIIDEQRRRLDAMGPVNLDAIAEYEELEERLNLIQEQHDDLVASKEELLKVIARINRTTKAMFQETFEAVTKNFRTMFTELFGKGAQANLVLLDEEDPLECGIEIIAKPPGKKLQSISLLSGGERSMTAVALLFAIYMVKPSPFCVLDELDAPLDEANIERFVRVLDRFIDRSQFIIVTHSKRTMSRADVIYGVSMEEFGVSKTLGMTFSSTHAKAGESAFDLGDEA